jgi:hypothetical protein
MTKRQPEADQTATQAESTPRRTRTVRRSVGKKHYIQFLPESADSEPEFKIELPAHVDPERFIDKQEDFEVGRYRIALRDEGKFTRETWIYRKDDLPETVVDADDLEDDEADNDLLVNGLAQAAALPENFDKRVAEIAARAAIAAVEAKERMRATQPAPQQPDPFAFVERSLEIEEKIRARAVRNNPPREESKSVDSSEQFIDMLDRFTTIAERIQPIREADKEGSGGLLGGLASLVREVGTHGKSLLPLLPALMGQPNAVANGDGAHAAGQAQTNAAQVDPVNLTLTIIVDDLKKNKRTGHAADAIDDLFMKMPDLRPQLEPFFAAPANELLSQLSATAGENLLEYSHSITWIESLQAEFENGGDSDEVEKAGIEENSEAVSEKNSG